MLPAVQGFNPNDPYYKCCCSSCHVVTGAWIIGILEAVMLFGNIVFLATYMNGRALDLAIGPAVISAIIISLLFHGLHKQKVIFILPHLVLQVLGIIGMLLLVMFVLTNTYIPGVKKEVAIIGGIFIGMSLLVAIVETWFFRVVLLAYRYLQDKQMYATAANAIAMNEQGYTPAQPPYSVSYP